MYYITTTIPYVNGSPHLGHLLEAIFNDTMARYKRRSYPGEVKFSMGLDQHGLKIYQQAQKENLDVKEYIAKESVKFKEIWQKFEISNTVFVETTSIEHKIVAQMVWQKLLNKNLIYKKKYTGNYCVGCEAFYADGQLDEHGNCPIHLKPLVEMSEENYFFKLSAFKDVVEHFLVNYNIKPEYMKHEWLNFIKDGLEDVSISRERANLPHGVDVPNDETQVMYIWFEALINYLTGLVNQETIDKIVEFPFEKDEFEKELWENIEESMPINLIYMGKDMSRFHLVLWIAMLDALNLKLTENNLIHGFINDSNGIKFSKSLGNGVYPNELLEKFGVEGSRFVMLYEINNLEDSNFDWQKVTDSYNAQLADNLGNLAMRITNLVEKYLNGRVDYDSLDQTWITKMESTSSETDTAEVLKLDLDIDLSVVYKELENFNPQKALHSLFAQSTKINQFLETTKPWSLAKDMDTNLAVITKILTQSSKAMLEIGKCLSIFMPQTGEQLYQIFNAEKISKAEVLFPKIENEK